MRSAANRIEDQGDRRETSDTARSNRAITINDSAPCYRWVDEVVTLDDDTPLSAGWMSSLAEHDLRLIEAILAVLETKQNNSTKRIHTQINEELDWE